MRAAFCDRMIAAGANDSFVFLTGDLGFKALEPLREAIGKRFINAGVAEQNMVSMAAGLARAGMRPWAYSIAPFIYARPFEQIRNDVCLHDLSVVLVGNGGGYGYGVMGATHHAIEDYGALLCFPNMRAFVPAFDDDLVPIVGQLMRRSSPAYLRLGLSENVNGLEIPSYAPWRRLLARGTRGATVLVVGPLVGGIANAARSVESDVRPSVWLLSELPIDEFPREFIDDLVASRRLIVVEEHVEHGGAGEMVAAKLLTQGVALTQFSRLTARGYPSGLYGSQAFHRKECGLDPAAVLTAALRD